MTGKGDGEDRYKMTGVVLSDVPRMSPGGRLTAPTLTMNPQSKKSNQASSASKWGIMFSFLVRPYIYLLMCSLKGSLPVVYKITSRSLGFRGKSHHTPHVSWHLDVMFLLCITWAQGLCACYGALFWLCMHQQALSLFFLLQKSKTTNIQHHTNMYWIIEKCLFAVLYNNCYRAQQRFQSRLYPSDFHKKTLHVQSW